VTEPGWIPAPAGGLGYRLREGANKHVPPIVMLHGLSGDEKVMWVLEAVLPKGGLVASPRGLYPLPDGGYRWKARSAGYRSSVSDFVPAVKALVRTVEDLEQRTGMDRRRLVLLGFSQGAGVAFAAAALSALRPAALVALAGYLPEGDVRSLAGLQVYWGHGLRDDMIPIERARSGVERLREVGAVVNFCETDVGHKLGVECARDLRTWMSGLNSLPAEGSHRDP
jgi:phospholipase/carboxylesterase